MVQRHLSSQANMKGNVRRNSLAIPLAASPLTIYWEPTMDTSKALDNDGSPSQVSWFQGSVFPTASFTVVLISNNNPLHAIGLQIRKIMNNESLPCQSELCFLFWQQKEHIIMNSGLSQYVDWKPFEIKIRTLSTQQYIGEYEYVIDTSHFSKVYDYANAH